MIQQDLLLAWGGNFRKYEKNQPIFFEGNKPLFYYQVAEGAVRMVNTNDDGKEFIQGILKCVEGFVVVFGGGGASLSKVTLDVVGDQ